ncbi:MAG: NPCBM/NEW2 domain-containing protein [Verrucomicrobiae bacterium]|nr:NPCBM/NEW2 domain-containing protein [Verrucomicrobiae bacterium]
MIRSLSLSFALLAACASQAFAWGTNHHHISQAAADLLPPWQREIIKDEIPPFVARYCLYPDVAGHADAKPYIMPVPPDAKALLHLPGGLERNKLVFDYYLPRVVTLFRQGEVKEAMRFFGSVAHYLEDSSCPAHFAHGDIAVPEGGPTLSQPSFIAGLMLLPPDIETEPFHARIDACPVSLAQLKAAVRGYRPRLLGASVDELIFHVLEQHHQMNARTQRLLIPMMQALGERNQSKFVKHGIIAAAEGARLLADVLYSVLSIAQNRFDTRPPGDVCLADFTPARTPPFTWSDRNHQGRLIRNASGSYAHHGGEPPGLGRHPLRLRMPDGKPRTFAKGFGVGWRTEYTFFVPTNVFAKFTVWAGNDAGIGAAGTNTFVVLLDGKIAATSRKMRGLEAPAEFFEIPLAGATNLTLRISSEGLPSRTHGVWAEPMLRK